MGFGSAISICFRKYADFTGRARRSEYWYFVLFTVLALFLAILMDAILLPLASAGPIWAVIVCSLLLPNLAVQTRRLHDIGRSGDSLVGYVLSVLAATAATLVATALAPQAAFFVTLFVDLATMGYALWLLALSAMRGSDGPNPYGPDPRAAQPT